MIVALADLPHGDSLTAQIQKLAIPPKTQLNRIPYTIMDGGVGRRSGCTYTIVKMTSITDLAVVCTVPTTIGFWKREYGVSYAYGIAMAASGAVVMRSATLTGLSFWHSMAHLVYGVRLCLFLLWRELYVPKFRTLRDKIEARAPGITMEVEQKPLIWRLVARIAARVPFILGCSMLYFCMSLPLLSSARCPASAQPRAIVAPLLALAYTGLTVAAVGDLHKSLAKARRGERTLVTKGLYTVLRHPNYTGEQILWFSSALVGIISSTPIARPMKTVLTWTAIVLGQLGIQFVLMQATTSLNERQRHSYADDTNFRRWRAFAGFELKKGVGNHSDVTSEATGNS